MFKSTKLGKLECQTQEVLFTSIYYIDTQICSFIDTQIGNFDDDFVPFMSKLYNKKLKICSFIDTQIHNSDNDVSLTFHKAIEHQYNNLTQIEKKISKTIVTLL